MAVVAAEAAMVDVVMAAVAATEVRLSDLIFHDMTDVNISS